MKLGLLWPSSVVAAALTVTVITVHGAGTGARTADDPPAGNLNVFVTSSKVEERKKVDDATKKQLKASRDAARETRQKLEKSLKDQFGKKRESWPPEKDDELYRAEEAEALANVEYEYRKIDLKALEDSAKDLAESIEGKGLAGKKEHMTLVSSAADAHVVLEIAGRRSEKTLPTQFKPDRCYILFNIGAGGKVDAAKFTKTTADFKFRKVSYSAWKIQSPTPERPLFSFEAYNANGMQVGCMGAAANAASVVAEQFAKDHYAALSSR